MQIQTSFKTAYLFGYYFKLLLVGEFTFIGTRYQRVGCYVATKHLFFFKYLFPIIYSYYLECIEKLKENRRGFSYFFHSLGYFSYGAAGTRSLNGQGQ